MKIGVVREDIDEIVQAGKGVGKPEGVPLEQRLVKRLEAGRMKKTRVMMICGATSR